MPFESLKSLKRKSAEQREFLDSFEKYLPVIDSPCEMNRICHYMESINFNIKAKLKKTKQCQISHVYIRKSVPKNDLNYLLVLDAIRRFKNDLAVKNDTFFMQNRHETNQAQREARDNLFKMVKMELNDITSDKFELTNYLVEIFYKEFPSYNKNILFQLCGKYMVENVKQNCGGVIQVPMLDEDGDFVFLNQKYRVEEVKND
jgi:hypothetical protein